MGHLLIPALRARGFAVAAVDLVELPSALREHCIETVEASILDFPAMDGLLQRRQPSRVFHLAAILSAKAEREPELAHQVNVKGTLELIKLCLQQPRDEPLRFFFPSSIAVYGLPCAETKATAGAVRETEWTVPTAVYGCNKLYCELIGSHMTRRRSQAGFPPLDFRSIRFPGLISADTMPAGGTTDYAPEMIHAAAQGRPYTCFVEEETRLPFMTMPDAIEALLRLTEVDASVLSTRVYNIRGFSASAGEIAAEVQRHFPEARICFEAVPERQALVDTWPADVDDALARSDWGLAPNHGLQEALGEYLIPALVRHYARAGD